VRGLARGAEHAVGDHVQAGALGVDVCRQTSRSSIGHIPVLSSVIYYEIGMP